MLYCMDSSAVNQMSTQEFQNILRRRSVVITNCTKERLEFDLEGLGRLADVDHQMDIQGDFRFFCTSRASDKRPLQIKQSRFLMAGFNAGYLLEVSETYTRRQWHPGTKRRALMRYTFLIPMLL